MNSPPPIGLRAPTTAEQETFQEVFSELRDSRDSVANARNDLLGIAWGGKGKTHDTEHVVDISTAFSVYASTAETEGTPLSCILRVVYVANDLLFCAKSPKGLQDQMKKHLRSLLYAASKLTLTDDSQKVKFERIIKLWKDKGVYEDVDDLFAAFRGELLKAEGNDPVPETTTDAVVGPAVHQFQSNAGTVVSNPLTQQQNVPILIPPAASAIPQYQMAPVTQFQSPEIEKYPQQAALVQLPPPDFQQQQQIYHQPPFVHPGQQQPQHNLPVPVPPHSLPPPTLPPPVPVVSSITNFPSQQPGQSIPNQSMQLPVGMQQPWIPPPMQPVMIPPPGGLQAELMKRDDLLQLQPPRGIPGVHLPPMPLPPPPSQGFFPHPMPQPSMPPMYPPVLQNAVLGGQFPHPIPGMPMPRLNPPVNKISPPKKMDDMSGGQLVHIITAAIEEQGCKPYYPLPQHVEPQAPLMSPRKANKILERVDVFCSRLSRDKEDDRDTKGRSERRRSSRSRSRSPKNNSSRRRSRSRSRSWSPRRSSRSKRR